MPINNTKNLLRLSMTLFTRPEKLYVQGDRKCEIIDRKDLLNELQEVITFQ